MIKEMKISALTFIISNLKVLVSTASPNTFYVAKIASTFKISLLITPLVFLLEGLEIWAISNLVYINLVVFAIFFDWILGTLKHIFWLRDFHFKKNLKGVIVKLLLCLMVGAIFEGINYLTIDFQYVTRFFMSVLRLFVFMYPAMSVIRSSRVISGNKFPPQELYDKIERWSSTIGSEKKSN